MSRFFTALLAGVLFGSGLLLSGMTNPATVLAFLDVAGNWNPALALTMGGAVLVAAPAYYLVRRRAGALGGRAVELPASSSVDAALLTGAAIFGVGWGLSGICPGPGLILLAGATVPAIVFVISMVAGMLLARTRAPARGGDCGEILVREQTSEI